MKEIPLLVKLKNFDMMKQTIEYIDNITNGIVLVIAPSAAKESLHVLLDKTITHVASHVDSTVNVLIAQLINSLKNLNLPLN